MNIKREEVIMPGGKEITFDAEPYLNINVDKYLLSVACGTGEIECYLADKYQCQVVGMDLSEYFISRAQKKAFKHGLNHLVQFMIGDGNSLGFPDETFDSIFCSGALAAFFKNGLEEFHRVLKPRGRAAISEVIWTRKEISTEIKDWWTKRTAIILTHDENCQAFSKYSFQVVFSKDYHKTSWWEKFYEDRGNDPQWLEEKAKYRAHKKYLAIGLFILEKSS